MSPSSEQWQQATDPGTPGPVLQSLAAEHPDLRAAIAANPSTAPDLQQWLREYGLPEARDLQVQEAPGAGPSSVEWQQAIDPAASGATLQALAARHPELRAAIAANPATPDDLRAWLRDYGLPESRELLAAPAVDPSSAPYSPATNTFAILALVFGVGGGVLGIVFGHLALRQIDRTGEQGRGLAQVGLVFGYLGAGLLVIVLLSTLSVAGRMNS